MYRLPVNLGLVIAFGAVPATAQEPLAARAFLPPDYRSELKVDVRAMDELGFLGAVARSPLEFLVGSFEDDFGFAMDELDRISAVFVFPEEQRQDARIVWTFEGGEVVTLPPIDGDNGRVRVEIEGHEALQGPTYTETRPGELYYSPRPGVLVHGSHSLMHPILAGERTGGGVPVPDLMALTSGRDTLVHMAFGLTDTMRADMPPFMRDGWLDPDDLLQFMVLRLRRPTGDDAHVFMEVMFRCEKGTTGPARIEDRCKTGLAELSKHPRLGALKRYWKAVTVARSERDVTLSLDLGTPRQASNALPALLGPMFLMGASDTVEAVPMAPAKAEPARDPKPASRPQGGKKK